MDFQDMKIELHKDKNIGKVLFIVEGSRTEPYIMTKLFTSILDYQLETKLREKGYKQYNSKVNPDSKIFVINAQQSNIRFIERDDGFLDNLFKELIEKYDFDIDLVSGRYAIDAKSIMGIFSLDLSKPIQLNAHTDDADKFLKEIDKFIVK